MIENLNENVEMLSVEPVRTIINHRTAEQHISSLQDLQSIPINEIIGRIITLNQGLAAFWGDSGGWAPIEAAQLLSRSRLDWQVSLSKTLNIWIRDDLDKQEPGHLILAWVNIGSLTEGTLKLFLSAFYHNYARDVNAIYRKGKLKAPDGLTLEPLRILYRKRIWDEDWDNWIQHIQDRRNAIHSFQSRDIGSHDELHDDIRRYLQLIRYINFRLPYPDDLYRPQESNRPVFTEDFGF